MVSPVKKLINFMIIMKKVVSLQHIKTKNYRYV